MKQFKIALMGTALGLGLAACGGGGSDSTSTTSGGSSATSATIKSVALDMPLTTALYGHTLSTSATVIGVSGAKLSGQNITWTSSAPNIASVAADGTVSLVSPGTTQIVAAVDGVASNAVTVTVKGYKTGSLRIYDGSNCVITEGELETLCWGDTYPLYLNNVLQSATKHLPVRVLLGLVPAGSTLLDVAPGFYFNCLLANDGKPYCWQGVDGAESLAQIAKATTSALGVPTPVKQGDIPTNVKGTSLAIGPYSACLTGSDGNAYCWGKKGWLPPAAVAQPGSSDSSFDGPKLMARGTMPANVAITSVLLGTNSYVYLGSDGKVYWNGATSTPVALQQGEIPTGVKITAVSSGDDFYGALGDDGWAYLWGSGDGNRFGAGGSTFLSGASAKKIARGGIPQGVKLTSLSIGQIAGANCVTGDNGKAYCWNKGNKGILGDGNANDHTSNVPVEVLKGEVPTGVALLKVSCGNYHCAAEGSDRRLYSWGWGDGYSNGLGSGSNIVNASVPTLVNRAREP